MKAVFKQQIIQVTLSNEYNYDQKIDIRVNRALINLRVIKLA